MAFVLNAAASVWRFITFGGIRSGREIPTEQQPEATITGAGDHEPATTSDLASGEAERDGKRKAVNEADRDRSAKRRRRGIDEQGDEIVRSVERDPTLPPQSEGATAPSSVVSYPSDSPANAGGLDVQENYTAPSSDTVRRERLRRIAQGRSLLEQGWSYSDQALYQKLTLRGLEPLLPHHWEMDFRSLPFALFTENDNLAFLRSLGRDPVPGRNFRATKELENLLDLGVRVRESISLSPEAKPENIIRRAITSYHDWAMVDAGLLTNNTRLRQPILDITTGDTQVSSSQLQKDMGDKLANVRKDWKEFLQERGEDMSSSNGIHDHLPPIYGVVVTHTVLAFVSLLPEERFDGRPEASPLARVSTTADIRNADDEPPKLRTIALFDFKNPDYDVWNSFAIAILVIHCRKSLMEFWERRERLTTIQDMNKTANGTGAALPTEFRSPLAVPIRTDSVYSFVDRTNNTPSSSTVTPGHASNFTSSPSRPSHTLKNDPAAPNSGSLHGGPPIKLSTSPAARGADHSLPFIPNVASSEPVKSTQFDRNTDVTNSPLPRTIAASATPSAISIAGDSTRGTSNGRARRATRSGRGGRGGRGRGTAPLSGVSTSPITKKASTRRPASSTPSRTPARGRATRASRGRATRASRGRAGIKRGDIATATTTNGTTMSEGTGPPARSTRSRRKNAAADEDAAPSDTEAAVPPTTSSPARGRKTRATAGKVTRGGAIGKITDTKRSATPATKASKAKSTDNTTPAPTVPPRRRRLKATTGDEAGPGEMQAGEMTVRRSTRSTAGSTSRGRGGSTKK